MTINQKIALCLGVSLVILIVLIRLWAPILSPFFIGALLAYLFNPVVNKLMQFKLSRTLATIIVFVLMLVIILAILIALIPIIQHQVAIGLSLTPKIFNWVQQDVFPLIHQRLGLNVNLKLYSLRQTLMGQWRQAGDVLSVMISAISHSSGALVSGMMSVLLVPVVTFYLLRDWHRVITNLQHLLPRKIAPLVERLAKDSNEVIGAFFRGQLLVMLGLGIIYALGLTLAGIQLGIFIGLLAGLLSIVPYLGFIVGLITALIATIVQYHDGLHILYVLIVFAVGQIAEGSILTPLFVGDRIGLHPVAVIFAVLAGGQLFGFIGVLLALPVSAVIMVLLRHIYKRYLDSDMYQQGVSE